MPLRHCAVCRREAEKDEFLRVVRFSDGTFIVDETGRANGRGAYICRDRKCIEKAAARKALDRSFRGRVPSEIYRQIESEGIG